MNVHLHKILVVGTWVILGALLADSINVTDLLPSIATIHADEDIGCNGKTFDFSVSQPLGVANHSQPTSQTKKKDSAPKTPAAKITIFDQDSPCVAAGSFSSSTSYSLFLDEKPSVYADPLTAETLYIKLCTLLI
jgi:hypothetical protein